MKTNFKHDVLTTFVFSVFAANSSIECNSIFLDPVNLYPYVNRLQLSTPNIGKYDSCFFIILIQISVLFIGLPTTLLLFLLLFQQIVEKCNLSREINIFHNTTNGNWMNDPPVGIKIEKSSKCFQPIKLISFNFFSIGFKAQQNNEKRLS